jgi:DNA-directed RNA polymerase specialized sigma24 family protein
VAPRLTEPIDRERASEREAFRLRERGATYKEIGEALGVSDGKAHHMVRVAHQRAVNDAFDVIRPPGQTRKRTPERLPAARPVRP